MQRARAVAVAEAVAPDRDSLPGVDLQAFGVDTRAGSCEVAEVDTFDQDVRGRVCVPWVPDLDLRLRVHRRPVRTADHAHVARVGDEEVGAPRPAEDDVHRRGAAVARPDVPAVAEGHPLECDVPGAGLDDRLSDAHASPRSWHEADSPRADVLGRIRSDPLVGIVTCGDLDRLPAVGHPVGPGEAGAGRPPVARARVASARRDEYPRRGWRGRRTTQAAKNRRDDNRGCHRYTAGKHAAPSTTSRGAARRLAELVRAGVGRRAPRRSAVHVQFRMVACIAGIDGRRAAHQVGVPAVVSVGISRRCTSGRRARREEHRCTRSFVPCR